MTFTTGLRLMLLCGGVAALAGCGGTGLFNSAPRTAAEQAELDHFNEMMVTDGRRERIQTMGSDTAKRSGVLSLFGKKETGAIGSNVNRHLWNASLDVLNFLPVETVDPYTGVISTGYGTPPGGGTAYRATIYISDPALDARSLKLSMQTRSGASVSAQTLSAVEDAILTRARQLRVRDSGM